MSSSFEHIVQRLAARLDGELPGWDAQKRMEPARPQGIDRKPVEGRPPRDAAVLMLLMPVGRAPHLVVTVRRDHLAHHPGQVSLPGGRREDGESLMETALREAYEEVGLAPNQVDVVGELTPLFIFPSNFLAHPFLAVAPERPGLQPHDDEVERIVEVPLGELLDESVIRREMWTLRGMELEVPYYDVQGLQIWGATAMMLAELIELVRAAD